GTFVIVATLLLVGSIVVTMRAQQWFKPTHEYFVLLPEGSFGLKPGSEVQILGITVGAVSDVRPKGDQVQAEIEIDAEFSRFVFANSVALVKKKFGVAGDAFLEIDEGSGEQLPEGGTLERSKPFEELPGLVEQLLADIKDEALPTLHDLRTAAQQYARLAESLSDAEGNLQRGLGSWGRFAEAAVQGEGTLGRLIRDPTLFEKIEKVVEHADALVLETRDSVRELRRTQHALAEAVNTIRAETRQAPGMIKKTQAILDEMQRLTKQVRQAAERLPSLLDAVDESAHAVPGFILQAQKTLHSIERLIEGLQRHWLVRRYMPEDKSGARLEPQESGTKR
ncbi:MAG: MlaD family protein, partial [Planctomycetota bacterium]